MRSSETSQAVLYDSIIGIARSMFSELLVHDRSTGVERVLSETFLICVLNVGSTGFVKVASLVRLLSVASFSSGDQFMTLIFCRKWFYSRT